MSGEVCIVCGKPAVVKVGQSDGVLVDLCREHLTAYLGSVWDVLRDLKAKLLADRGRKTDEEPGAYVVKCDGGDEKKS